jgi:uncharacterized membrane protein
MNNINGNKRPTLKIPYTWIDIVLEAAASIGMLMNVIIIAVYWGILPNRFATHFDFSGKANGWGGRGTLIFLPIIVLVLYFALSLLEKYPESFNYIVEITEENAEYQYKNGRRMIIFLKVCLPFLFGYLQWAVIQAALNGSQSMMPYFLIAVVLIMFMGIGYFTYKSAKHK